MHTRTLTVVHVSFFVCMCAGITCALHLSRARLLSLSLLRLRRRQKVRCSLLARGAGVTESEPVAAVSSRKRATTTTKSKCVNARWRHKHALTRSHSTTFINKLRRSSAALALAMPSTLAVSSVPAANANLVASELWTRTCLLALAVGVCVCV